MMRKICSKLTALALIPMITILFSCENNLTNHKRILNAEWEFLQKGSENYYPAKVPGNVHLDLLNNSLIEDPFYSDNENKLQWIESEDWIYRGLFELTEEEFNNENIEIELKGLDTYADVYLNDSLIHINKNMFVGSTISVKELLQIGKNKILINFKSPIKQALPLFEKTGITYPADNDKSTEHLSVFTRKAPYHYGWDWGPRFVTSGIYKPININFWNKSTIRDVQIELDSLNEQKAFLNFTFEIESNIQQNVDLSITSEDLNLIDNNVNLKKGINSIPLKISIENPKLWWPAGYGDPNLYDFKISISQNSKLIESTNKKYGIRDLKVVYKNDSMGDAFYFKVNGQDIYAKGANLIPSDVFLGRVNDSVISKIFENAIESHFNMLRVWGGGVYQDDKFYDLADENGILIWQDFMFACTMYPGDNEFLNNVKQEVIYNVKRLRNHPSIGLWCGNNEIAVGWKNWGWQKSYSYTDSVQKKLEMDYDKLFMKLIPNTLDSLDKRFYLESSPIKNWGELDDMKYGDNHYWGVWWGDKTFESYNEFVPRFMSEYGFQSFPNEKTLRAFAPQDQWKLNSTSMYSHQKSSIGNNTIEKYRKWYYNKANSFVNFVYLSQLLQADAMDLAIKAHRRNKPFNMGTLYWQFNDVWPGISWSAIDYFGRWKAAQYKIKLAYNDVISSTIIENDTVSVYLVSDKINPVSTISKIKIGDFDGEIIFEKQINYTIGNNKSELIYQNNIHNIIKGKSELDNLFLNVEVEYSNDKIITKSQEVKNFVKGKDLSLKKPSIKLHFSKENGQIHLKLKSDTFVKSLELYTPEEGNWSDNYFDLLPREEKIVHFKTDLSPEKFKQTLRFKSLIDTY